MTKELMTEREKQRSALHKKICNDYTILKAENPTAATCRICSVVAKKFKMSEAGVRQIIYSNGLATPRPYNRKKK